MEKNGKWITLENGVHLFLEDGQTVENAIEKNIKKEETDKKTYETANKLAEKGYTKNEIADIQTKIKDIKDKLGAKEKKNIAKVNYKGEDYYIAVDLQTGNMYRTKEIENASPISSKKLEKLKQKYDNISLEEKEFNKNLSYSEKSSLEEQLKALESGYLNIAKYKQDKEIQQKEQKEQKVKDYENSFIKTLQLSTDEDAYYSSIDEFRTQPFISALSRYIKKELGGKEIHTSAKSGSKYGSSVYLDVDGTEIRISDHELPQTAERESRHEQYGTRWDKELVLTNSKMQDIIKLKTKEEFDNYVKGLFDKEE